MSSSLKYGKSPLSHLVTSLTCYYFCFAVNGRIYCSEILTSSNQMLRYKKSALELGDYRFQNYHFGRYIVGHTVGNLVLRRRARGAMKRDFQTYIRRYTAPNENVKRPLKKRTPKLVFITNCRLMQVKSIAECSLLQYVRPS